MHAHIAAERERQAKTDACLVPLCPLTRGLSSSGTENPYLGFLFRCYSNAGMKIALVVLDCSVRVDGR